MLTMSIEENEKILEGAKVVRDTSKHILEVKIPELEDKTEGFRLRNELRYPLLIHIPLFL